MKTKSIKQGTLLYNAMLWTTLLLLFHGNTAAQCDLPRANLLPIDSISLIPCQGTTVLLKAAYKFPGLSVQWYRDAQPISGAVEDSYAVIESGTYSFRYVQGANCISSCYDEAPISFRTLPAPAKPQLSLQTNPDTSVAGCYRNFVIGSTSETGVSRTWLSDGRAISGQSGTQLSPDTLGIYQLRIISADGCIADSDPIRVDVGGSLSKYRPRIERATVVTDNNGTERCKIFWQINSLTDFKIKKIRIFREVKPGVFRAVATVPASPGEGSFLDPTSTPSLKPYYYRIQALLQSGSDSFYTAPSPWHRCLHLNISRNTAAPVYHLGWIGYLGLPVTKYIIRPESADGTELEPIELGPDVSGYTFSQTGITVTAFQIEAVGDSASVYFPFGRIAAPPRKSLSNTRPTIQNLSCSQSAFNADLPLTAIEQIQSQEFRIFPSPSLDGSCYLISTGKIKSAALFDCTGKRHTVQLHEVEPGVVKLTAGKALPNGLYVIRIAEGNTLHTLRWILQQ